VLERRRARRDPRIRATPRAQANRLRRRQQDRQSRDRPSREQARRKPTRMLSSSRTSRTGSTHRLHDRQEKERHSRRRRGSEKIKATQDALAARIQAARKDAKAGDIFTPEIRQLFRRLMYPELKGPDAPETKTTIMKEDAGLPTKTEVLKVNAPYPEGKPLPTMPPNILTRRRSFRKSSNTASSRRISSFATSTRT
jgi:hypothetical protein